VLAASRPQVAQAGSDAFGRQTLVSRRVRLPNVAARRHVRGDLLAARERALLPGGANARGVQGGRRRDRRSLLRLGVVAESGDSGPGPHSHEDNLEIFYVIEGTMSFLVDEEWLAAPSGSFLRVPAGVTHTFENRSRSRAGALHVSLPGGFEATMPAKVGWFAQQNDSDTREK
jgi:mannose-6-phosphate isomerase-like protein (cupin superfamily)